MRQYTGAEHRWVRQENYRLKLPLEDASEADTNHGDALCDVNLLKPTGHVMYQQFNIQQLYVLPALYLCVLYLYENKQRLVPLTA